MKTSLYLDTSVPSALFDNSKPIRQLMTQKWFENQANKYNLYSSVVALDEISRIKNEIKRDNIYNLFGEYNIQILQIDQKVQQIAQEYINQGAIPKSEIEDALHIAVASINKIENLVSWNFKHIVSENPVRKIHQINKKLGLDEILIGSPEFFGGYVYGNL